MTPLAVFAVLLGAYLSGPRLRRTVRRRFYVGQHRT